MSISNDLKINHNIDIYNINNGNDDNDKNTDNGMMIM